MIHPTPHAIERARRRLGCASDAEAIAFLTSPMIERAANLGASAVILPSGHRIILAGHRIVTVTPKSRAKRRERGHCRKPTRAQAEREIDVDTADMAELLVRIDRKYETEGNCAMPQADGTDALTLVQGGRRVDRGQNLEAPQALANTAKAGE